LFLKIVPGGAILKNKKFCRDQKQFFFLQGPKLKRVIFAGASAILKPLNIKVKVVGGRKLNSRKLETRLNYEFCSSPTQNNRALQSCLK